MLIRWVVKTISTNAVYIPSLDGKDIYISNHYIKGLCGGYRLKNQNGAINYSRFINTLDYSLDLIKLRDIFNEECPNQSFSFMKNGKEYTTQIINVTFKYSNKLFNRVRNTYYVKFGYSFEDLTFSDCIAVENGELIGVQIDEPVDLPQCPDFLNPYFKYDEKKNCYTIATTIPTLNAVADIRSEIYQHGFICNGIKYVRFKRSSGSSRVGKCLFINERLYAKIHEWEMCGIHVVDGQDIDLAALEPYIALTLSSIIDTIQIKPENILVIPDFESKFHEKAIATRLVNGRLISKPEYVEITNSIWDGQSLMDKSLFGIYENKGMLLLRARFFKSCCFNTNIQAWFADHQIKNVKTLIKAGGMTVARKIDEIKLITTPSSIKYLKFGSLKDWLNNLETTFGVVKHEKKTHFFDGRMVQTHYQLINTLQMTYDEVEQFVKPSLDYARMIKTDPAVLRHQIGYQYCAPDKSFYTSSITSKNDIIYKLLGINDKFSETKMYRNFCNDLVKSFIKNLRCGHVLVHGNYSTLCGNPIEMLKMAIGQFDGTTTIKKGTVHCEMFESGRELLGSRSPHVTIGNILVTRNEIDHEIQKYMNSTNEIVYVNSIQENLLERLSGADFDSDTILLTDNKILVDAAKRNYASFPVPTKLVKSAKRKRKYTSEEKADLDLKTSVNKIGEIINLSQELNSILWDRLNHGATISDVMELYCDISQLDVMSNLEIDSAKKENPANNTYELKTLKKKYDIRDKKNRHVRPLFFKYIDGYKGYRDDYHVYIEQDDEFQKLFKTDSYKNAKEIKNNSDNNIIIERGRMSYKKHETSMDYLQKAINKFYVPRNKTANHGLSHVLIGIANTDGDYDYESEKNIIDAARKSKSDINAIWNSMEYSNREKREITSNIRDICIAEISNISFSEKTLRILLEKLEGEYSDISRYLFYMLLEHSNGIAATVMFRLLAKSVNHISTLYEDKNGDVIIYDFHYLKLYGESEDYDLNYENQDDFVDEAKDFINKYGIRQDWLAEQVNIPKSLLPDFFAKRRRLPKQAYYDLYSFIKTYKNQMMWLKIN